MQIRKELLENDSIYHIFSRSIAGYIIFNDSNEYDRFYQLLRLCRFDNFDFKYSRFARLDSSSQMKIIGDLVVKNESIVEIVAYCLMPTHIHLILKQTKENGISTFMARVLNGYSRYFNTKHQRIGPLWSGRFKNVLVKNDNQLLHLTRYIHLNPTSGRLVEEPGDWEYSSFNKFIQEDNDEPSKIINIDGLFDFTPESYRKFVLDRKSYQRELSKIKLLLIEDYTG